MQIDLTGLIFVAIAIVIGLFVPLGLWWLLPSIFGGCIGLYLWQTGHDTIGASVGIFGVLVNVLWYLFWDKRM
jgi:hypothetical protein